MPSLIIDGYNLIGTSHKDLKKQRDALVDTLIKYGKAKGHEITVVFDGWKTGEAEERKSVVGGVNIVFSRIGDTADVVIERMISSRRREWIVVSSDREIARHAWSCGSVPVSSEEFLGILQRNTPAVFDEDADDYLMEPRKGNARQLSKKEKAVRKALQKL
ncbi:MAG: NYN domain-containing protein [Nitrospirota bacterium]